MSVNIGGGTQRIAKRALARPFEHRVGEQQDPPAAPHPMIERDEVLGGLGERMRHQQQPALRQIRRSVDADRHDAVAAFKRFQSGRTAALERKILTEHQRQAGQQEQASAAPAVRPNAARASD